VTQAHGRRYEHTLVNDLDDVTTDAVWVTSAGYSGNSSADDCDIVVTVDSDQRPSGSPSQINIEGKKRQGEAGKRISNAIGGSSDGETGVEELERLVAGTPVWAEAKIALKISRRKLFVITAETLLDAVCENRDAYLNHRHQTMFEVLEPRLTPSRSISLIKPETGVWPSATAASGDGVVLADELNLPYNEETQ